MDFCAVTVAVLIWLEAVATFFRASSTRSASIASRTLDACRRSSARLCAPASSLVVAASSRLMPAACERRAASEEAASKDRAASEEAVPSSSRRAASTALCSAWTSEITSHMLDMAGLAERAERRRPQVHVLRNLTCKTWALQKISN